MREAAGLVVSKAGGESGQVKLSSLPGPAGLSCRENSSSSRSQDLQGPEVSAWRAMREAGGDIEAGVWPGRLWETAATCYGETCDSMWVGGCH